MAVSAYCKKCRRDVPLGETCPLCGAKLGKNAARSHWHISHLPVSDWMCWNAVMRLTLPAFVLVFVIVFLSEILSGEQNALTGMLQSGLLRVLCILFVSFTCLLFLCLILQGRDEYEYIIDNAGIHRIILLPGPAPVKLLTRLKAPFLPDGQARESAPPLNLGERILPWKNISRVQIWPEKLIVIFYQPFWWERFYIRCTADCWESTLDMISEKLGKKKKIVLPPGMARERSLKNGPDA